METINKILDSLIKKIQTQLCWWKLHLFFGTQYSTLILRQVNLYIFIFYLGTLHYFIGERRNYIGHEGTTQRKVSANIIAIYSWNPRQIIIENNSDNPDIILFLILPKIHPELVSLDFQYSRKSQISTHTAFWLTT